MDTKEITVNMGRHDSSTYKGVETRNANLILKGSVLVITGGKVSYFNGDILNPNEEQIGSFTYRTKEYNPEGHPNMSDYLSCTLNRGESFALSAEANELILASINKIESETQTQNTK